MALMRWIPPHRGLHRWEPFREIEEMKEAMDRLVDDVWRGRPTLTRREWVPAVDMIDKKSELLVKAELPGMDRKDIHISITGDLLTIKGERKAEKETKEEDYYCCESSYGSFSRAVSLPVGVETDKITAEYKNGILEVHLPKTKEVKEKTKEVPVK
jgi:HSP20 family protein